MGAARGAAAFVWSSVLFMWQGHFRTARLLANNQARVSTDIILQGVRGGSHPQVRLPQEEVWRMERCSHVRPLRTPALLCFVHPSTVVR